MKFLTRRDSRLVAGREGNDDNDKTGGRVESWVGEVRGSALLAQASDIGPLFGFCFTDDDDEVMLNVLRCQLTY